MECYYDWLLWIILLLLLQVHLACMWWSRKVKCWSVFSVLHCVSRSRVITDLWMRFLLFLLCESETWLIIVFIALIYPKNDHRLLLFYSVQECIIIITTHRDRKSFQWNTPRLYSGSFINTYILCRFLNLIVDHTNSDHLLKLYFSSISALELPTMPAIALNPIKLILVLLWNADHK